jgi:hypothetical protein
MDNLQGQLCNFMDNCFEKVKTLEQTFALIQRFQALDIPCLREEIFGKYEIFCLRYKDTLDKINRDYNDRRNNNDWHVPQDWPKKPGIVRYMEFLVRRITQPMMKIKEHAPHLLEKSYTKKNKMMTSIIEMHNRLAKVN